MPDQHARYLRKYLPRNPDETQLELLAVLTSDDEPCEQRHPVTIEIACQQRAHKPTIGCSASGVTDGVKWTAFWWPANVADQH